MVSGQRGGHGGRYVLRSCPQALLSDLVACDHHIQVCRLFRKLIDTFKVLQHERPNRESLLEFFIMELEAR